MTGEPKASQSASYNKCSNTWPFAFKQAFARVPKLRGIRISEFSPTVLAASNIRSCSSSTVSDTVEYTIFLR
jgi:hypothetical protein